MATKKKTQQEFYGEAPTNLDDHIFFGIVPDPSQKKLIDAVWKREKKMFLVNSIAGSGKTLIATALGMLMVKYNLYDKIVYVTFPGIYEKSQGFLPGDLLQKSEPYFQPLYDALIEIGELPDHICNTSTQAIENGTCLVECAVSTYMRGINLKKAFVIIDEAENADLNTLVKVVSRINDDCLVMIIGHSGQCDMYDKTKSGFTAFIDYQTNHHSDICEQFELMENHRGNISLYSDLILEEYEEPKYGFIYMTRNNVTGKLYIGQHKRTMNPKDIDDSWYLGSGVALQKAILKYGEENFDRVILYECDSASHLDYMEKIFINYYNAVDDDMFYNLATGGRGKPFVFTDEIKQRMRHPHKPMSEEGRKNMARQFSEETRKKLSESAKANLTGYQHSDESKHNMSEAHKGSRSIFKDGVYKYVKDETLDEYLADGWILQGVHTGKSMPRKDTRKRVHINNGTESKVVLFDDLEQYYNDGWELGRLDAGTKSWIHNDCESRLVSKEDLQNYLDDGWNLGRKIKF